MDHCIGSCRALTRAVEGCELEELSVANGRKIMGERVLARMLSSKANLTLLDLSSCDLCRRYDVLLSLRCCSCLTGLNLAGNLLGSQMVRALGLDVIRYLLLLEFLDISDNNLTFGCVQIEWAHQARGMKEEVEASEGCKAIACILESSSTLRRVLVGRSSANDPGGKEVLRQYVMERGFDIKRIA
mmetsp:Transcript_45061/g.141849  ORF Transcript_45061/g.141849 Transcript_45061/m.141849 type:complete len:186 (-) Transcript_45061:115-672(-)